MSLFDDLWEEAAEPSAARVGSAFDDLWDATAPAAPTPPTEPPPFKAPEPTFAPPVEDLGFATAVPGTTAPPEEVVAGPAAIGGLPTRTTVRPKPTTDPMIAARVARQSSPTAKAIEISKEDPSLQEDYLVMVPEKERNEVREKLQGVRQFGGLGAQVAYGATAVLGRALEAIGEMSAYDPDSEEDRAEAQRGEKLFGQHHKTFERLSDAQSRELSVGLAGDIGEVAGTEKEAQDAKAAVMKIPQPDRRAIAMYQQASTRPDWVSRIAKKTTVKATQTAKDLQTVANVLNDRDVQAAMLDKRVQSLSAKPEGFLEETFAALGRGEMGFVLDQMMGDAALIGDKQRALQALNLQKRYGKAVKEHRDTDEGFLKKLYLNTLEMLPPMVESGAVMAVPGIGGAFSGYAWALQGMGQITTDLMREGYKFETARQVAPIAGIIYAAIEQVQVGQLAKFGKGVTEGIARDSIKKVLLGVLRERGGAFLSEVWEEGLQELTMDVGKEIAKRVEGDPTQVSEWAADALKNMGEAMLQAAGPMGVLSFLGVGGGAMRGVSDLQNLREAQAGRTEAITKRVDQLFGPTREKAVEAPEGAPAKAPPKAPVKPETGAAAPETAAEEELEVPEETEEERAAIEEAAAEVAGEEGPPAAAGKAEVTPEAESVEGLKAPATLEYGDYEAVAGKPLDVEKEIDGLTELPNNTVTKAYEDALPEDHYTLSFDGDLFKAVNDEFGHKAGDLILKAVGRATNNHFPTEFKGREGGEEFFVDLGTELTPEKLKQAQNLLEFIGREVKAAGQPFTISGGIGRGRIAGSDQLASDRLAFRAKETGRNRLVVDKGDGKEYTIEGIEVKPEEKRYVTAHDLAQQVAAFKRTAENKLLPSEVRDAAKRDLPLYERALEDYRRGDTGREAVPGREVAAPKEKPAAPAPKVAPPPKAPEPLKGSQVTSHRIGDSHTTLQFAPEYRALSEPKKRLVLLKERLLIKNRLKQTIPQTEQRKLADLDVQLKAKLRTFERVPPKEKIRRLEAQEARYVRGAETKTERQQEIAKQVHDAVKALPPGALVKAFAPKATEKQAAAAMNALLTDSPGTQTTLKIRRGLTELIQKGWETPAIEESVRKEAGIAEEREEERRREPSSLMKILEARYPVATDVVDGLRVRENVPNMASIRATLEDYVVLKGIREVPLSVFDAPPDITSTTKALASEIGRSKEINPLIVVIEEGGPYILEGAHRYDAMKIRKAKSIPALVVVDVETPLSKEERRREERRGPEVGPEARGKGPMFQRGKKYGYGLQYRPAVFGAVPKGFAVAAARTKEFPFGTIEYDKPLTRAQEKAFQLIPLDPEHPANLAKALDKAKKTVDSATDYGDKSYSVKRPDGGTDLYGPDTRRGGDTWRVTHIDATGKPTGHVEFDNYQAARDQIAASIVALPTTPAFQRGGEPALLPAITTKVLDRLSPKMRERIIIERPTDVFRIGAKEYKLEGETKAAVWVDKAGYAHVLMSPRLTPAQRQRALAHEIIGHVGAYSVMSGDVKIRKRIDSLYKSQRNTAMVKELRGLYGDNERILKEEWIARNMEDYIAAEKPSTVARLVWNAVKDFLRRVGVASDNLDSVMRDMLKQMKRPAAVARGAAQPVFARKAPGEPFYSPTLMTIEGLKQEKGVVPQIQSMIKKGQFKKAEVEWMGLEEWLEKNPKATKTEVAEFVRGNQIEVEETLTAERPINRESKYALPEVLAAYETAGGFAEDEIVLTIRSDGDAYRALTKKFPELAENEDWAELVVRDVFGTTEKKTKFSSYTLPGGENYRELLLRMPEADVEKPPTLTELPAGYEVGVDYSQPEYHRYHVLPPGQTHARPFHGRHPTAEEATAVAINRLNYEREDRARQARPQYRTGHFDEPNIFAHARLNDRTTPEGERVLFIEEIQSDWAREAREKGVSQKYEESELAVLSDEDASQYGDPEKMWFIKAPEFVGDKLMTQVFQLPRARHKTEQDAIQHILDTKEKRAGVPDFPFKKNWQEFALKRILAHAVEGGYDRVAWISGEQTADRYDLGKKLSEIGWARNADGTYDLSLRDVNGQQAGTFDALTEKELAETIGKEPAQRIVEAKTEERLAGKDVGTLRGDQLRIGSQWAVNLYDKMIPKFLGKYGKQWGAKVGPVSMGVADAGEWYLWSGEQKLAGPFESHAEAVQANVDLYGESAEVNQERDGAGVTDLGAQQSIPITPEMREAVLGIGQPMFSRKSKQQEKVEDEIVRDDVKKAKALQSTIASLRGTLRGMKDKTLAERAQLEIWLREKLAEREELVRQSIYQYARDVGIRGVALSGVDTMIKNAKTAGDLKSALTTIDKRWTKAVNRSLLKKVKEVFKAEDQRLRRQAGKGHSRQTLDANESMRDLLDQYVSMPDERLEELNKSMEFFTQHPEREMPPELRREVEQLFGQRLEELSNLELAQVLADVKQIKKFGFLKYKLREQQEQREQEAAAQKALKEMGVKAEMPDPLKDALGEERGNAMMQRMKRGGEVASVGFWSHIRPERIVEWFAGWKQGSVFKRMTFDKVLTAERTKWRNMKERVADFDRLYGDMDISEAQSKPFVEVTYQAIDEKGKPTEERTAQLTLDKAMFIYANSRNIGNRAHLQGTWINDAVIEQVELALPDKAKAAIDAQLEYYDTLQYDRVNRVFMREHRVRMPREKGYFPIHNLVRESAENALMSDLIARYTSRRMSVEKGHTMARVHSDSPFGRMSYFESVTQNMRQVEQYIAYADATREVNAFLSRPDIQRGMKEKSPEAARQLRGWINAVAYGKLQGSDHFLSKTLDWVRQNHVIAVLGLNLVTTLKQTASLAQGMARIKNKPMAMVNLAKLATNPPRMIAFVKSKSLMMENRTSNWEREIAERMEQQATKNILKTRGISEKVRDWAMKPITLADQVTTTTLWYTKYQESLTDGMSEQKSIDAADELIRKTQPVGGLVHLAGVYRGTGIERAYTMFTNQLNQNANLLFETQQMWGQKKSAEKLNDVMWLMVIPSGLIYAMSHGLRPPWEDPLGWAQAFVSNLFGGVMLLNRIMDSAMIGLTDEMRRRLGHKPSGRRKLDYLTDMAPPGFSAVADIAQALGTLDPKKLPSGVAKLTGVPGWAQGRRTIRGAKNVLEGRKDFIEGAGWKYLIWSKSAVEPVGAKPAMMERITKRTDWRSRLQWLEWYQGLDADKRTGIRNEVKGFKKYESAAKKSLKRQLDRFDDAEDKAEKDLEGNELKKRLDKIEKDRADFKELKKGVSL